jgi:Endosomal/lysosomal potassium channel TMEM175
MESESEHREELQLRDVGRVEAFSDGVFAFAVTLLVLAIRIPRPNDPDAAAGLQHLLLVWGTQSPSSSISHSQKVTEQPKARTGYDLRPS